MQTKDEKSPYWLSLEEWSGGVEANPHLHTEFVSSPLKGEGETENPVDRREFLKLMGASLAMASASGCIRRPVQKLVPYVNQPQGMTLGVSSYYTSVYPTAHGPQPILVKTREGRPLHVEANPEYPGRGVLDFFAQAHVHTLYDPERLKGPIRLQFNDKKTNFEVVQLKWEDLDEPIVDQLIKGKIRILTPPLHSPSLKQLIGDFFQGFKGEHVEWAPQVDTAALLSSEMAFGKACAPKILLDKVDYIVSIDSDFLGSDPSAFEHQKQFIAKRRNPETMSKLVTFESLFTVTGMNSDERFRICPHQQVEVAMALVRRVAALLKAEGQSVPREIEQKIQSDFANDPSDFEFETAVLDRVAKDLVENRGKSVVLVSGNSTRTAQALGLHLAALVLNQLLGNEGKTIDGTVQSTLRGQSAEPMRRLIRDMKAGQVETLIVHDLNVMNVLPDSAEFADGLKKVKLVIYTGDRIDETGVVSNLILPSSHPLESWGDAVGLDEVYSLQQPTISEMFSTKTLPALLMGWAYFQEVGPARLRDPETYHDYVKAYWASNVWPKFASKEPKFEDFWNRVLKEGFCDASSDSKRAERVTARKLDYSVAQRILKPAKAADFELVLYTKPQLGFGDYANSAWLQEVPDPVTKIAWDNYAMLSPATGKKFGLRDGQFVRLSSGDGKQIEVPVHIQPGVSDKVVGVALGYGRKRAGTVGDGVGVSVREMMNWGDLGLVLAGRGVKIEPLKKRTQFACTQDHHSMENRPIALEASLVDYKKDKGAGIHRHKMWSLWEDHKYTKQKWGMSVDLNSCTGCSLCVVACQSENNVPTVGKKYLIQGREMHWIRIDRYYKGDPSNPTAIVQPVMCQHCDNAPCESVCPVIATVHDEFGLNSMIYNRCVGTRYCANNCPYKVRRFNWFNYTKNIPELRKNQLNPSVTVRMRGVMEKCTFCVQRIKAAKDIARHEGERELRDGEVKPACEASCPTQAIVFGDLNDKNSRVSQQFTSERAYTLLEEWNAKPAVRYLTKVRNIEDSLVAHHHEGEH